MRVVRTNGHLRLKETERQCRPEPPAGRLLEKAMARGSGSRPAGLPPYHRLLRVARTIADLEGAGSIRPAHVAEAVQYRALHRSTVKRD